MFLITVIGLWVDVPLSTEQLFPLSMFCVLQILSMRFVIALENIFLSVSIRVIGLVLSMFFPQSDVLGIGMMFARFHSFGVRSSRRILLNSLETASVTLIGAYFQHSYVIFDGPAALLLGVSLMVPVTSSIVNGVVTSLKASVFTYESGV